MPDEHLRSKSETILQNSFAGGLQIGQDKLQIIVVLLIKVQTELKTENPIIITTPPPTTKSTTPKEITTENIPTITVNTVIWNNRTYESEATHIVETSTSTTEIMQTNTDSQNSSKFFLLFYLRKFEHDWI